MGLFCPADHKHQGMPELISEHHVSHFQPEAWDSYFLPLPCSPWVFPPVYEIQVPFPVWSHGSTTCPESLFPVSSSEPMHGLLLNNCIPIGQTAGTGWMLDNKTSYQTTALHALSMTFPPTTPKSSSCSSLLQPEQSTQKCFLPHRRPGERACRVTFT